MMEPGSKRGIAELENDREELQKSSIRRGRMGNLVSKTLRKRGCQVNLVDHNEDRGMELPGFGEWSDSSWPSGSPKEGGTRCAFFLSETKLNKSKVEKLRYTLEMPLLVYKVCARKSGGLAMLLKRGINLDLRGLGRMHIDVTITEEDGYKWRL